jgi:signal transduction histidine kinase
MSSEYLEHLFEPFSQESEGVSKEYQGVGLGLAIAKRYLDLHQLDIRVHSDKGVGSKFEIRVPLA